MTSYNSRPIPNDTLFMDLKTPRFLVVEDLTERWKITSMDVEISRFTEEDTWPAMNDIDPETKKPRVKVVKVMYFKSLRTGKEFPRGMKVDAQEIRDGLRQATGAKTVGDMIGKHITIIVGQWRKQPVLRISPDAPRTKPATGHNQPQKIEETRTIGPKLQAINTQYVSDPLVAFSTLTKAAGLDSAMVQEILRECGGDYDAAFLKISTQYAPVIG